MFARLIYRIIAVFLGQYDDLTYLDYKIRPMRIKDNITSTVMSSHF